MCHRCFNIKSDKKSALSPEIKDIIRAVEEVQELGDTLKEPLEETLSNLVFSTIAHHTGTPISPEVTVTLNESDKTEDNEEPIFELLKPDEIFVLYKDSGAVVYIGNKDGKLFIEKSLWKDAIKSE